MLWLSSAEIMSSSCMSARKEDAIEATDVDVVVEADVMIGGGINQVADPAPPDQRAVDQVKHPTCVVSDIDLADLRWCMARL